MDEDARRFNDQFRETPFERNRRLRDLRQKQNRMLVDRIQGIASQPATAESDNDPQNPNTPTTT